MKIIDYKLKISSLIRSTRIKRSWTQKEIAEELGISQNRYSEIERGKGSFTAEQLLVLVEKFNLPLASFVKRNASKGEILQNALARFGAKHLAVGENVFTDLKYENWQAILIDVLTLYTEPRHVTSLAPVLVQNAGTQEVYAVHVHLYETGFRNRLGWLLDNVVYAIEADQKNVITNEWKIKYKRVLVILSKIRQFVELAQFNAHTKIKNNEDVFDLTIFSERGINNVIQERSNISKKWNIITRIQPDDFAEALTNARQAV